MLFFFSFFFYIVEIFGNIVTKLSISVCVYWREWGTLFGKLLFLFDLFHQVYISFIIFSAFITLLLSKSSSLFQLYYLRLPKDIKDYHIFLMDATVATGAAAIMAIRVLLDHEVPEDHISLCSLLMTEQGGLSWSLFYAIWCTCDYYGDAVNF